MSIFDDTDKTQLIEQVFAYYGHNLPRRPGWVPIRCIHPNHEDKHRSATVNWAIGRYKCHACGMAGDGFDLLLHIDNIKAVDAEKILHLERVKEESDAWLI